MKHQPKIIAVAGKGGVGKTSVAAAMIKVLTKKYPDKRILAIDADPAVGLATALGIQPEKTIDDIRIEVVETVEDGQTKAAIELLGEARYKIFETLTEKDGFAFIAVGRPESAGCYCKINTYLKDVITLLSEEFDYIVIDGEAGIEQINRRVMEKVTHLLLITDPSRKGIQVIQTIKSVAERLVMYEEVGVIINRILSEESKRAIHIDELPVLAEIMADGKLSQFDLAGENVFYLPDDTEIVKGAARALQQIGV
ncbi:AAA family ATPase [Anaerovoracaceae bacterium 41-7]|jgi:CO dehydrogenase maturation factor|uniref:Cobyrinic acid a,c-diamide synthase n=1 Tax=Anaerotruncus colihominis TaxID=169435 RepID=A0A845QNN4_9FIRM|nr:MULTISPECIES: AAA family ATPase [Clostridia]MCI9476936.1 AAA family ATPase [Emergencia sp.]MCI9639112.1 AAA family ATPase [Emergencia sp.]NBH62333.1 cobyrinic acid a,c-diamide synthase [Anaerotruncus colihominis]NCE99474.1 cobyrinic acid a,c-diamide synthase [Emergencia sp. 1XD21-10]NCF02988.1 cobyrinic acid a,c-diamide synthase [Anaerotruncus sp. 80]